MSDRHSWLGPNYLSSESSTQELAHMIKGYWESRGKTVSIRVEQVMAATKDKCPCWVVRSDMLNGAPRE
jgi:hypothetical protein